MAFTEYDTCDVSVRPEHILGPNKGETESPGIMDCPQYRIRLFTSKWGHKLSLFDSNKLYFPNAVVHFCVWTISVDACDFRVSV